MPDEAVELDEGARIEELDEPLAREQLALLALALDRLVGTGVLGLVAKLVELVELRLGGVGARVVRCRHRRSVPRACGSEPQAWSGQPNRARRGLRSRKALVAQSH
jgi:hypothetical protein